LHRNPFLDGLRLKTKATDSEKGEYCFNSYWMKYLLNICLISIRMKKEMKLKLLMEKKKKKGCLTKIIWARISWWFIECIGWTKTKATDSETGDDLII